jgi:hypothetical protein
MAALAGCRRREEATQAVTMAWGRKIGWTLWAMLPVVLFSIWTAASPATLYPLTYEDGVVESLSFILLLMSAGMMIRRMQKSGDTAVRQIFPALWVIALLIIAGEEISWGQRLLGFTPPEMIFAANRQQEMNLHNMEFVYLLTRGDAFFMAAMVFGLGLLLPILALSRRVRDAAKQFAFPLPPWMLAPAYIGSNLYNRQFQGYFPALGFERSASPEVAELLLYLALAGTVFFFIRHPEHSYGA